MLFEQYNASSVSRHQAMLGPPDSTAERSCRHDKPGQCILDAYFGTNLDGGRLLRQDIRRSSPYSKGTPLPVFADTGGNEFCSCSRERPT